MNIFNSIRLRYKILVFPAIFVIVVGAIFYSTRWGNELIQTELDKVQYSYIPYNDYTSRMKAAQVAIQKGLQDAVSAQDTMALAQTSVLADEFRALVDSAEMVSLEENNSQLQSTLLSFNSYYQYGYTASLLMIQEDYSEDVSRNVQAMISELDVLKKLLVEVSGVQVNDAFENARNTLAELRANINKVLFISLALFIGFSLLLSHAISGALKISVRNIQHLSDGHLNVKIKDSFLRRRDEIGDISKALNTLVTQHPCNCGCSTRIEADFIHQPVAGTNFSYHGKRVE